MSSSLVEQVVRDLSQNQLVTAGQTVVVAVSGGADSVCLLHVLSRWARENAPVDLVVAHVDHALRAQSAEDACFVEEVARQLGWPFYGQRVDVAAVARREGWGIEEAGREVRREFLATVAARFPSAVVALAHHRDDQSETVLMHLARGCGVSGLAGMRPRDGIFIRPLLGVGRTEIHAFLSENGLEWHEDESNRDQRYKRNLVRHQVIPALSGYNAQAARHIAEAAQKVAVEEDYWAEQLELWLSRHGDWQQGEFTVDVTALCLTHPAFRYRLFREMLGRVRGSARALEAVHFRLVDEKLSDPAPQWQLDLPGCWVARRYDSLVARQEAPSPVARLDIVVDDLGCYPLGDGRVFTLQRSIRPPDEHSAWFSVEELRLPLRIRSFQPGDKMRIVGMNGHKKLKALFAERRWSHELRQQAVVVESSGEILWVPGLCRSPGCGSNSPDQTGFQLSLSPLQK
jgi:tRNA(Ile)-lysidine synthase